MKKIFISILILISFSSFADVGSDYSKWSAVIKDGRSLSELIRLIKNGSYNPFVSQVGFDIVPTPNRSGFTSLLIAYRFDPNKQVGNKSENIELLKTLLIAGDNPDLDRRSGDSYGGNPILEATVKCSLDALQILDQLGANLSIANYWSVPSRQEIFWSFDEGSIERERCGKTMTFLLSRTKEFNIKAMNELLSSGFYYNEGDSMQYYPPEILNYFEETLKVKFSKKPNSSEPKELLLEPFLLKDRSSLQNRISFHARLVNKWSAMSTEQKEWSCYYSTIDEVVFILKDHLKVNDDFFHYYDNFFLDTFVPFCDSLK